jgi:hypothetical protein
MSHFDNDPYEEDYRNESWSTAMFVVTTVAGIVLFLALVIWIAL